MTATRPSSARWLDFPDGLEAPPNWSALARVPLTLVYERGDGTVARYRVLLEEAWSHSFDAYAFLEASFETYNYGACYFVTARGPGSVGASKGQRRLLDDYIA
jgi:hypothetical protein